MGSKLTLDSSLAGAISLVTWGAADAEKKRGMQGWGSRGAKIPLIMSFDLAGSPELYVGILHTDSGVTTNPAQNVN